MRIQAVVGGANRGQPRRGVSQRGPFRRRIATSKGSTCRGRGARMARAARVITRAGAGVRPPGTPRCATRWTNGRSALGAVARVAEVSKGAIAALFATAVVALLVVIFAARGIRDTGTSKVTTTGHAQGQVSAFEGALIPAGVRAPDFSLRDQR